MSAFVVSNKTLNRAVSAILRIKDEGHELPHLLDRYTSNEAYIKQLRKEMLIMNISAVLQRYPGDKYNTYADQVVESDRMFEDMREQESLISLVTALDCFLYQCSEGLIPDTLLFSELSTVADMEPIDRESYVYESAKWN